MIVSRDHDAGPATGTVRLQDERRRIPRPAFDRLWLDPVAFDAPVAGRPFAALRSMYVTDINNDVARIAVLESGAKGWREQGILGFKRASATQVWMGRVAPSRHNTSSPDMAFSAFADHK